MSQSCIEANTVDRTTEGCITISMNEQFYTALIVCQAVECFVKVISCDPYIFIYQILSETSARWTVCYIECLMYMRR